MSFLVFIRVLPGDIRSEWWRSQRLRINSLSLLHFTFFVEVSADKKSPDVTVRYTTMLIYSIDGSHRLVTPEGREIADEHNHIVNYRVWWNRGETAQREANTRRDVTDGLIWTYTVDQRRCNRSGIIRNLMHNEMNLTAGPPDRCSWLLPCYRLEAAWLSDARRKRCL